MPPIDSIEIHDDGIGFTDDNTRSFDTLYSAKKAEIGGKGYGRVTYLKFFSDVKVESIYQEGNEYYKRTFEFTGRTQDIVENEKNSKFAAASEPSTVVYLNHLKERYQKTIDKRLATIARHLVERLLPYFINEKFDCPTITLEEAETDNKIVLNDFFAHHDEIQHVTTEKFELEKNNQKENFEVKIFKIYFTDRGSSVVLTAHNREVTRSMLHEFIPEFQDDFYDPDDANKNYSIQSYVFGDYLDRNVSAERGTFMFPNATSEKETNIFPFARKEIEAKVAQITEDQFKDEVVSRRQKKAERIKQFVDEEAPWYKAYVEELDLSRVPVYFERLTLSSELERVKFQKEIETREKVQQILDAPDDADPSELEEKITSITGQLNDAQKSELAHYVVLRKVTIDLFKKALRWNDSHKYEKEEAVHKIIFPLRSNSDKLAYDDHNLWMIDERLNFTQFVSSDEPLNPKDKRPDILIFDHPKVFREGDGPSNPIVIFEFKRPQRDEYEEKDDPIKQIAGYVKKIRTGDHKDFAGRSISANENTPAYGFLVCDLTPKIREFCTDASLTMSPDQSGYFGFHSGYRIYFEVMSFDKLVKDSELRNKIFFRKLGIE